MTRLLLSCLVLVGCVAHSPTDPKAWEIRYVHDPIRVSPETLCGRTTCHSQGITRVKGVTDPHTRTITIWDQAEPEVLAWELCNAERFDRLGILEDRGCTS